MATDTLFVERMQGVISFIVLQIGWISAVLGAAWGLYWLGPVVIVVLCVLHLFYTWSWQEDLKLMLVLMVIGTMLDSAQIQLGFLKFRGTYSDLLCPLWISALWLHFGTLRHALLKWIGHRPWLAAMAGALGGPLAYLAGERMGAVEFHPALWPTLAALALQWGLVLPWAARQAQKGLQLPRANVRRATIS
jgi:Protein of unknown function (DUF2878)